MNKYMVFLVTLPMHAGGLVSHLVGPVVGWEIRQRFAELETECAQADRELEALGRELDLRDENFVQKQRLFFRAQRAPFLKKWARSGKWYTKQELDGFKCFEDFAIMGLLGLDSEGGWVRKFEENGNVSLGLDAYTAWIVRGI